MSHQDLTYYLNWIKTQLASEVSADAAAFQCTNENIKFICVVCVPFETCYE